MQGRAESSRGVFQFDFENSHTRLSLFEPNNPVRSDIPNWRALCFPPKPPSSKPLPAFGPSSHPATVNDNSLFSTARLATATRVHGVTLSLRELISPDVTLLAAQRSWLASVCFLHCFLHQWLAKVMSPPLTGASTLSTFQSTHLVGTRTCNTVCEKQFFWAFEVNHVCLFHYVLSPRFQ